MKSIWSENVEISSRKPLEKDIKVQNAVIGAGMAGILTAYLLKKEGKDVVVIEAERIAGGQTKNTTAKITSQHGVIYDRMLQKAGRMRAEGYAMANEDAVKIYERIIKEEKIDCHFKKLPSFLFTTDEAKKEMLEREAAAARVLGIKAHFTKGSELELPFETAGAVCFEEQAQFSPLEFLRQLSEKLEIYEDTKALKVKEHVIYTDRGKITAENIVFASHYPFINIPGFYFLRQHQERSYVLALKEHDELRGMYYSADDEGVSLRSAGDTLLLGGGRHRTGKNSYKEECENIGFSYIRGIAQKYYPELKETAHWAAQDCMPHDELPFIGRYSVFRPYWYVATGFKKWGMTSSMISAMIIRDRICGRVSPYECVFKPQRFLVCASAKNLLTDVGESVKGLAKGLFGEKERRCPHMGCRLEKNLEEESWDCPCHGSRFTKEGRLIDNPAQTDLKKSRKPYE